MKQFKRKLAQFLQGRYGADELGRALMTVSVVLYLLGSIFQYSGLVSLSLIGMLYTLYRMLSKRFWERSEENRRYKNYVKLWKLRYQERRTSRIFLCKSCGRMVRVPKGKGKIQVTCPVCGNKSIHRT